MEVMMGLEEIEKLKERLKKDPSSKLFVPLAEEYRMAGMYDEAIEVLIKGLEKHPNYTSARVALGKIYLEKGEIEKARDEFEKVVEIIPDNLYAHKKLAEIYKDIGNIQKALLHYEKVVELNPLDEETLNILKQLKTETFEPETEDLVETEDIFPLEGEEEEVQPVEEAVKTEEEVVVEEVEGVEEGPALEAEEISVSEEELTEIDEENKAFMEYKEFSQFVGEEVHEPESLGAEEVETEAGAMFATVEAGEEFEESRPTFTFEEPVQDIESMLSEADEFIKSAQYLNAAELYQKILDIEPENKKARQRLEELKYYIRFLGKDPDQLINSLEQLLSGIKKRQDEFFRGA
jgi:tetratricopeptide (TPR) repeat protein